VIEQIAPAKLNLFLHVVGRRSDGYHLLESLFVFTRGGDSIKVENSSDFSLEIEGPFASALADVSGHNEDNLVVRAAKLLAGHYDVRAGAAITLQKNLPVASGIGGGSADAAATFLALNELWGLGLTAAELEPLALKLGADVPACLTGAPKFVAGIGEQLYAAALSQAFHVLLVNPGVPISTPAIFRALHQEGHTYTPGGIRLPEQADASWLAASTVNDLQPPAAQLAPEVQQVLHALAACSETELVRMSGSGATCFAIFENESAARMAYDEITEKNRDWWVCLDQLQLA
jgi:4-diphosphocytidyl-2-C-methyl-D-erythritol kinase